MKKPITKYRRFISVWDSSLSAQEAGKRMGVSAKIASGMAYRLRGKGFNLKRMDPGRREGPWKDLGKRR
jgi:transposase